MTDGVHEPHDLAGTREAAATRYTLQRLMNRRSVRIALALSARRSKDSTVTWREALRGELPREDVISPVTHTFPVLFNDLAAISTGAGLLTSAGLPTVPVTAHTYRHTFRTVRPNLVLIDSVRGWAHGELQALRDLANEHGVPVVTVGMDAHAAVPDAAVSVSVGLTYDGAQLELGPRVDIQQFNPVGMYLDDTDNVTSLNADGQRISVGQARRAPVVTVTEPDSYGTWRVLELISSGALVLTGESGVLRDVFETDADLVVGSADGLLERRDIAFANPAWRDDVSVRLRRRIFRNASTYGAAATLVSHLSLSDPVDQRVSVVLATRRGGDRLRQVMRDLAAQTYQPHEVIVVAHGEVDLDGLGNGRSKPKILRVDVPSTHTFGAALNAGLAKVSSLLVAKIDDDDRYGPHHLEDLVHSLRYSGATVVGRRAHAVYDETRDVTIAPSHSFEERFDDHLPGGTLLTSTGFLRDVKFRQVPSGIDTELMKMLHARGGSAYSSHRFGYVRVRHGDHTYTPDHDFAGEATPGFNPHWLGA